MGQHLDKLADAGRSVLIEPERPVRLGAVQVGDEPLRRELHPLTRDRLPRDHVAGVLDGGVRVGGGFS